MSALIQLMRSCLLALILSSPNAIADIDPDALYTDKDHPAASDSNDGRYEADGGTGPFKTIQKLVDSLTPGKTGYVRKSDEPYTELTRKSGTDYSGITFVAASSGTEDAPVVLAGYPGEKPVIDVKGNYGSALGKPVAGFVVYDANHVTIRNFEIMNTTYSGVMTAHNQWNKGIILEALDIHDIHGSHNTGGIRLDLCEACIVRNNHIHHVYSIDHTGPAPPDDPYYGLHTGIHGYRPMNCIIEYNTIHDVYRAVFQKQPNERGGDSNLVRHNFIHDVYCNLPH